MLKRKTPLRAKPKQKTAQARRYHAHIASLGCLVCGGAATVHHVTSTIHGGRIGRDDMLVVPLAPQFHMIQFGPRESVEAVGHRGFYEMHGIDLYEEAKRLRMDWRDE